MNSNDCLEKQPLCDEMLTKMNAWWRAANYLAAGQLYLLDNPLLREPLKREHVKHKIVGHWGTVPGQNFVYTHLNRVIKRYDLDMIYISGPGHGGNFMVANTYMEGSYSEVYPNVSQDTEGMKKLFKQFSFPGGIQATLHPKHPVQSTKAVSLVTHLHTHSVRYLIIPILSLLVLSVTVRPKQVLLQQHGNQTNF